MEDKINQHCIYGTSRRLNNISNIKINLNIKAYYASYKLNF